MARTKSKRAQRSAESKHHHQDHAVILAASAAGAVVSHLVIPRLFKTPMNTSICTGAIYITELLNGHPVQFYNKFGMTKHVFQSLASELFTYTAFNHTKFMSMAEQLAIFLSFCHFGDGFRSIQEDYQHSTDTISKVIHRLLNCILDPVFYTRFVKLPLSDRVPPEIHDNPIFFPFFKDCLGAIDGTHINAFVPSSDHPRYRDRKGGLTQNVLAACTFDLRFCYVLAGWEGSAGDGRIFEHARSLDFVIPAGKYYLADAGFSLCNALLVPYCGVRYHLKEWGSANQRPQNKEELFNLWHAKARNAIERIFGIAKRHFALLTAAPEFNTATQARIVLALCCLHNVVQSYDPDDGMEVDNEIGREPQRHKGDELRVNVSAAEHTEAGNHRDTIASAMWTSYQSYLARRQT